MPGLSLKNHLTKSKVVFSFIYAIKISLLVHTKENPFGKGGVRFMKRHRIHSLFLFFIFLSVLSVLTGCWGINTSRQIPKDNVRVYYGENVKAEYLIRPTAVTTDSKGNIYVIDRYAVTGFIKKFNQQGQLLKQFAPLGQGDDQLQTPIQIAVDNRDNVYITDAGGVTGVTRRRRVQRFNPQGKFQSTVITFPNVAEETGNYGPAGISIENNRIYLTNVDRIQRLTIEGKVEKAFGNPDHGGLFGIFLSDYIYGPESVTADEKGNFYVLDTYSGLIRIFNPQGKLVSQFEPRYVDIGEALRGDLEMHGGNLFFLDTEQSQLTKFTLQGKVVWRVGSKGTGKNQFFNPSDLYIDKKGIIYVTDSGNRCLKILDSKGTVLAEIGKPTAQLTFFSQPGEVAVDQNRNIYVADTGNHRIVKLNPQNRVELIIEGENSPRSVLGDNVGKLIYPAGVAVDSKKNIYTVDYDYNRKQKFTEQGKLVTAFGPVGDIALDKDDNIYLGNGTYFVKLNPQLKKILISEGAEQDPLYNQGNLTVSKNGQIFMIDRINSRIKKFSADGKLLATFGRVGSKEGELLYPNGITLGNDGNIYVADAGNHRIQVFNRNGDFIRSIGQFGSGKGEFNFPQGVSFDRDGNLYVADTDNHRIVKISRITRR